MKIPMKEWISCGNRCAAAAMALATALPLPVQAQAWPAKPVTVVVPTTAGSGLDVIARFMNEGLTERLGQRFIVENRAGANAAIGAQAVARAAPDGYTLLVGTASSHAINPYFIEGLGYDPMKDFQPITTIFAIGLVLLVNPEATPVTSLGELSAWLKQRPGKTAYASGNAFGRITAEWYKQRTGLDTTHVPYKGVPQAMADLMAGRVHFLFADATAGFAAAKSGKVRALAVTNPKRVASAPEVPTMIESGLPGFESYSWVGLFYPAKTPMAITRRMAEATNAVMTSDKARAFLMKSGADPYPSSPEQLSAFVEKELKRWGEVARQAGIRPE